MKARFVPLCLATVSLLAVCSLALAQPPGRGPGHWLSAVPQEKREQVAKIYSEGRQKLYELESRKWARQAELNALLASPKPEASKIEALAKEIGNLGSMAYQERVALQQRIAKETGVNLPLVGGPSSGQGGCPGMGGGYGAYGPGGCPGMGAGSQLPPCCQTSPQAPGSSQ